MGGRRAIAEWWSACSAVPSTLEAIAKLAERFGDVPIVVDHLGHPDVAGAGDIPIFSDCSSWRGTTTYGSSSAAIITFANSHFRTRVAGR